MSTSRIEAFSDGVFAIAITLLVLDIRVPAAGPGGLWRALAHQWPSYASYAVSFLIIGIIWVNHHAVFEHITRADRNLLFLNLLLLMTVAFIPFPTALLAQYLRHGDDHVAAAVYSGTMAMMGVAFGGLWLYAANGRRLISSAMTDAELRATTRGFVIGTPVYLLAVGVAFIDATACLILNAALAIFYALAGRGGGMVVPATAHPDD